MFRGWRLAVGRCAGVAGLLPSAVCTLRPVAPGEVGEVLGAAFAVQGQDRASRRGRAGSGRASRARARRGTPAAILRGHRASGCRGRSSARPSPAGRRAGASAARGRCAPSRRPRAGRPRSRAVRCGRGNASPSRRRESCGSRRARSRPSGARARLSVSVGSSDLAVLLEVDDAQAVGLLDRARVRLQLADDHPQQRRLAGAVRSEDAEAGAGGEEDVEIVGRSSARRAVAQPPSRSTAVWSSAARR